MTRPRYITPSILFAASLLTAGLALAAGPAMPSADAADAMQQHRQELAVCNRGDSPEGRETCLRESQAAWAQEKGSGLSVRGADYAANASLRCQSLKGSDRQACITRMQGGGTVSGSVAGGGMLRELVTRTPGNPDTSIVTPPVPR